jgi:Flp pilus assembly protein TadG
MKALHDGRGQSVIEGLLITVLFVTLIFGGLELARAVSLKQALDRGAFEGARYLATHPDLAGATAVAKNAVGNAILGGDPVKAVVASDWAPGSTGYGDTFCLTVSYATTVQLPLVSSTARTLSARHCTVYEVWP